MTVICAPPSPTVRHAKGVTHSVLSLKKKVRFNERVRVRRRTQVPYTEEEFKAIWFTKYELNDRRNKDRKLRYAIARQPEVFGAEKLLVLGLFSEEQRRKRLHRTLDSRESVIRSQHHDSMDVDAGSDSDDSSAFTVTSTPTCGSYALHSEAAATEAYQRAIQHAAHVQTMGNEDDESEAGMSQELSVSSETVPKVEIAKVPRRLFGVPITV